MADIFVKFQSFLLPDIRIWYLELLKIPNFHKNIRCEVYNVKNWIVMSTFSGHRTQKMSDVKCEATNSQPMYVVTLHLWPSSTRCYSSHKPKCSCTLSYIETCYQIKTWLKNWHFCARIMNYNQFFLQLICDYQESVVSPSEICKLLW